MMKIISSFAFYSLICFILIAKFANAFNKTNCKCRVSVQKKVVGGKFVESSSYRWAAGLNTFNFKFPNFLKETLNEKDLMKYFSCGSSILNRNWVLTAAHCIPKSNGRRKYFMTVNYGNDNDLSKMFKNSKNHYVKRAIIHPDYHSGRNGVGINDIALLELERPINFAFDIGPACLGTVDRITPYPGLLRIVGWGSTKPAATNLKTGFRAPLYISRYLKENFVKDESDTQIACSYYPTYICADNIDWQASSCYGDSGGPIHFDANGKTYVVGLVSGTDQSEQVDDWRFMCTGPTYYTRISKFMNFIEQYIGKDYCSEED